MAIKDVMVTRAYAPQRLEDLHYIPRTTAPGRAIRTAGAIVLGKTNCDELPWIVERELGLRPVRNPRAKGARSRWSSGGSAAAGRCWTVCGARSDTVARSGKPAAILRVCRMMPTYGRVSRYGLSLRVVRLITSARSPRR